MNKYKYHCCQAENLQNVILTGNVSEVKALILKILKIVITSNRVSGPFMADIKVHLY